MPILPQCLTPFLFVNGKDDSTQTFVPHQFQHCVLIKMKAKYWHSARRFICMHDERVTNYNWSFCGWTRDCSKESIKHVACIMRRKFSFRWNTELHKQVQLWKVIVCILIYDRLCEIMVYLIHSSIHRWVCLEVSTMCDANIRAYMKN